MDLNHSQGCFLAGTCGFLAATATMPLMHTSPGPVLAVGSATVDTAAIAAWALSFRWPNFGTGFGNQARAWLHPSHLMTLGAGGVFETSHGEGPWRIAGLLLAVGALLELAIRTAERRRASAQPADTGDRREHQDLAEHKALLASPSTPNATTPSTPCAHPVETAEINAAINDFLAAEIRARARRLDNGI